MNEPELIEEIKTELQNSRNKLENSPVGDAVSIGDQFYDTVFTQVNSIRRTGKEKRIVINFCEELASFYLDCGYRYFKENRNATTTIDKMLKLANITLQGLKYSQEMQLKLDNAYQEWHWHGW